MTVPAAPHCKRRWSRYPSLDSLLLSTARVKTGIALAAVNNKFADVQRTVYEPEKTVDPFVITYSANRNMRYQNADEASKPEPGDLLRTDSTELIDAADVFVTARLLGS